VVGESRQLAQDLKEQLGVRQVTSHRLFDLVLTGEVGDVAIADLPPLRELIEQPIDRSGIDQVRTDARHFLPQLAMQLSVTEGTLVARYEEDSFTTFAGTQDRLPDGRISGTRPGSGPVWRRWPLSQHLAAKGGTSNSVVEDEDVEDLAELRAVLYRRGLRGWKR
jgi:hypothetical protein